MDRPRYFIAGVSSSPIVNTFLSFDMIVMERRSAPNKKSATWMTIIPLKVLSLQCQTNTAWSSLSRIPPQVLSFVMIRIYQWHPASAKQHGHFFNNQICPPLWASGGGFMYIMQFIVIPWRYALLMTIEWRVHPNAVRIVRWRRNDSFWQVCESVLIWGLCSPKPPA